MKPLNRKSVSLSETLDIKIIQFGEGNFLRAFVDYAIDTLNSQSNTNLGVAVVQPIEHGLISLLKEQDGLYTLFSKGYQNGEVREEKYLISSIVSCINPYINYRSYLDLAKLESLEFVISNTTESGIVFNDQDKLDDAPPISFPAKLTALLYERFTFFGGSENKGLTIIPCELINYNSDKLKEIILRYAEYWELGNDFVHWVLHSNSFHNTLVDRIVPGYPKDEIEDYNAQLDYTDKLIVTSELFFLWVIEGGEALKKNLPFEKTSLDVKVVNDMQPYRTRKVRILNGAHTSIVPVAWLFGHKTVKDVMDNPFTSRFLKELIYDEIIPTLELNTAELVQFADDVMDRFRNPYIKHLLESIALNSISKFEVRVLPSLLEYYRLNNILPHKLVFSFACLIRFYKGKWHDEQIPLNDDAEILDFFQEVWQFDDLEKMVYSILSKESFWGEDLNRINGLAEMLVIALKEIEKNGVEVAYLNFKSQI